MKCSQCDNLAITAYGDGNIPLCVDHYYKMQRAVYLQVSMMASQLNFLERELSDGTGGLVPPNYIRMLPLSPEGDSYTLNNINISDSTIGVINANTIQNIDKGITILKDKNYDELADLIRELIQSVNDNNELNTQLRQEIADSLEYIVLQSTIDRDKRSIGVIKSIISNLPNMISVSAGLLTIWDKIAPLLQSYLGM